MLKMKYPGHNPIFYQSAKNKTIPQVHLGLLSSSFSFINLANDMKMRKVVQNMKHETRRIRNNSSITPDFFATIAFRRL